MGRQDPDRDRPRPLPASSLASERAHRAACSAAIPTRSTRSTICSPTQSSHDLLGTEDGLAHYAFAVDPQKAAERGFPAELSEALEQATGGSRAELETWIGADGLPHRLDYVVRLEPVRNAGKLVLPARTIRVTYALSAFGKPVELTD